MAVVTRMSQRPARHVCEQVHRCNVMLTAFSPSFHIPDSTNGRGVLVLARMLWRKQPRRMARNEQCKSCAYASMMSKRVIRGARPVEERDDVLEITGNVSIERQKGQQMERLRSTHASRQLGAVTESRDRVSTYCQSWPCLSSGGKVPRVHPAFVISTTQPSPPPSCLDGHRAFSA